MNAKVIAEASALCFDGEEVENICESACMGDVAAGRMQNSSIRQPLGIHKKTTFKHSDRLSGKREREREPASLFQWHDRRNRAVVLLLLCCCQISFQRLIKSGVDVSERLTGEQA